jgi:hypothetical protein
MRLRARRIEYRGGIAREICWRHRVAREVAALHADPTPACGGSGQCSCRARLALYRVNAAVSRQSESEGAEPSKQIEHT